MKRLSWLLPYVATAYMWNCGAPPMDAVPAQRGKCDPPTFTEPGCVVPGCDSRGCTISCPEPDGTRWDEQPDGTMLHWLRANGSNYIVICTVEAS
jgi:hypothetical protein